MVLPSQSKYKSISQSDLSTRLNPVTNGGKLPGWRAEKTPGGVCPSPPGVKVDGGVSQSESSTLPFMSRNDLLFHTTKNRVGRSRSRRPPTRQRKMAKQVAGIEFSTGVEDMMPKNTNQTPPASSVEFSSYKYSPAPTSVVLVDTTSLKPSPVSLASPPTTAVFLDTTSPKSPPPTCTFTTFLDKPIISPKPASLSPTRNEVRRRLPDAAQHTVASQNIQSSDHKFKPVHSKPLFTPSKAAINKRRASLQCVTTPYKALQDVTTPCKALEAVTVSPCKAGTVNLQVFTTPSKAGKVTIQAVTTPFKAGINSTPSKALPPSSWLGEMNKRSGLDDERVRSGLVTSETEMMDRSALADVRKEFDKKLDKLENDLAEEKVARVKLEKEVEALKVIVTKLRL